MHPPINIAQIAVTQSIISEPEVNGYALRKRASNWRFEKQLFGDIPVLDYSQIINVLSVLITREPKRVKILIHAKGGGWYIAQSLICTPQGS